MPLRGGKRKPDFDPNKSDSDDETYGTSASKPIKSKSSKSQSSKQPRKKQRRKKNSDESDDDDEDDESIDDDDDYGVEEEAEEEEVEMGPTGRPRRSAAKMKKYEESDEDVIPEELENEIVSESEDDDELAEPKPKRAKKIISLLVTPGKLPSSGGKRRSTRHRSDSALSSRPTSSHMPPSRRSSRIAHDDIEEAVALTSSGHHAETVRQGTTSPVAGKRPQRGGKGIKKPSTSILYEESQESAAGKGQSTDELQRQHEVAASREDLGDGAEEPAVETEAALEPDEADVDEHLREVAIVPESQDEEDDDDPIGQPRRALRRRDNRPEAAGSDEALTAGAERSTRHGLRSTLGKRKTRSSQRGNQESSDFEPVGDEGGEEDFSDSEASASSPRKKSQAGNESSPGGRGAKRRKIGSRSRRVSDEHDSDEVADELADELDDLKGSNDRRRAARARAEIIMEPRVKPRRQTKRPDYRIINPELQFPIDEDDGIPAQGTPSKRARGAAGAGYRSLFSTYGPFGGAGGPPPVLGGPAGLGATAGADSDSSDDDTMQRPRPPGIGGMVGMTPTAAHAPNMGLFPATAAQVHGADPTQTPAGLGKVKDKQALADADPLGVDQNIDFDAVGGLQGHIDQLKEMVALPLLYPEVFQRFHVTPPRGVLFHGPPGTGKTLLARALASSVSSQGKKVTFYMRKGADALSKWVGEAEKQLRLLFEEARKNQPSIIFFDEIDGTSCIVSSLMMLSALLTRT